MAIEGTQDFIQADADEVIVSTELESTDDTCGTHCRGSVSDSGSDLLLPVFVMEASKNCLGLHPISLLKLMSMLLNRTGGNCPRAE